MQDLKIEGHSLVAAVEATIKIYIDSMDKTSITNLYDLLMEQIEPVLFKAVIEHSKYNQSRAASMLGLSRGTLRKKLTIYFDDQYCGTRDN